MSARRHLANRSERHKSVLVLLPIFFIKEWVKVKILQFLTFKTSFFLAFSCQDFGHFVGLSVDLCEFGIDGDESFSFINRLCPEVF